VSMPPSGESHITNSLVSIKDFSYLNAKQRSKVNVKFFKNKTPRMLEHDVISEQ